MQYYYMGEMNKSRYYVDRMMRGKVEKKDSRIREIYLTQLEYKEADKQKHRVNFVSITDITEKLDQIR